MLMVQSFTATTMKRHFYVHFLLPLLFAISPILFFLSQNIYQTALAEALVPMGVAFAGAFVLYVLATVVLYGCEKAALAVALFSILFFAFGHIRSVLEDISIGGFDIGRDSVWLTIFAAILFFGLYSMWRTKKNLAKLYSVVAIVGVTFTVISVATIGTYVWQHRVTEMVGSQTPSVSTGSSTKPSIYYIILDGYARSDTLKEIYAYDNSDFLSYLKGKGFFIASKSHSNYAWTHVSLASSLNMAHMTSLSDTVGINSEDRTVPFRLIEDNEVQRFLKSQGYTYIHVSSGLNRMTDKNRNADIVSAGGKLSEFSRGLLKTTALYPFIRRQLGFASGERVLYSFASVERASTLAGPRFVFAHIILPHPPFLFGPAGERITDPTILAAGENVWKFKDQYRDQVIFANKKVKEMVDIILKNEKTPPVIIIQGDHGPGSEGGDTDFDVLVNPSERLIKERMNILNAYYFPDKKYDALYDDITPVNSFRVLFNTYFGTKLSLLEDKSYISPDREPYRFFDVTDIVKKPY